MKGVRSCAYKRGHDLLPQNLRYTTADLLVYNGSMRKEQSIRKRDSSLTKLLVQKLQKVETQLTTWSHEVGALRDEIEFPLMIEEIKATGKNLSSISASWLQRRYGIGYARAARLLDQLRKS
jgi:DNA segregation ATPase FtsK/SpoIIIE-like protein